MPTQRTLPISTERPAKGLRIALFIRTERERFISSWRRPPFGPGAQWFWCAVRGHAGCGEKSQGLLQVGPGQSNDTLFVESLPLSPPPPHSLPPAYPQKWRRPRCARIFFRRSKSSRSLLSSPLANTCEEKEAVSRSLTWGPPFSNRTRPEDRLQSRNQKGPARHLTCSFSFTRRRSTGKELHLSGPSSSCQSTAALPGDRTHLVHLQVHSPGCISRP